MHRRESWQGMAGRRTVTLSVAWIGRMYRDKEFGFSPVSQWTCLRKKMSCSNLPFRGWGRVFGSRLSQLSRNQLESTWAKREPSKWHQDWQREDGFVRSFHRQNWLGSVREGGRLEMTTSRSTSGSLARWWRHCQLPRLGDGSEGAVSSVWCVFSLPSVHYMTLRYWSLITITDTIKMLWHLTPSFSVIPKVWQETLSIYFVEVRDPCICYFLSNPANKR